MLSLEEVWIKAAVEHKIMKITYFSARTKREITNREIEPDFVGLSKDGKNIGCWATFCHLRQEGPRLFKPDSIRKFSVIDKIFSPPHLGRWKELIPLYERKGLKNKNFGGERR